MAADTTSIVYTGPDEEVTLAGGFVLRKGEPADIPTELADGLDGQPGFERAKSTRGKGRGSAASSRDDVETR